MGAPINVKRSVRQGCPLSPLLFCVYIETLCQAVIQNDYIKGFQLQAAEVKLLAYGEDVVVCCKDTQSVLNTVSIVRRFGEVTNSFVNCLGFWHGRWASTPDHFSNVSWVTTPVKYLAAPLDAYKDSSEYWKERTKEIKEKADRWKACHLSIFGRATPCNMFWHVMQVLQCSRINVQKLHRVFAVFVWASSWERCSPDNLFRRVKDGGFGLAHLFLRQLVNRFFFFRDTNDPFLHTVIQMRLSRALPEFVVGTETMTGSVRVFFREVVDSVSFLRVRFSNA